MVEARGVSLTYPDGAAALKNIDFEIGRGQAVFITGPSGSGKTSLLKLLMGIEVPTEGALVVLGQPVIKGQTEEIRQLRLKIGPVFQEFKLIKGRTALENVMTGMRITGVPSSQLKERAYNALERVGLRLKALSLADNLSWGECQRTAIARAIAKEPELILADEPTGNLDRDNAINIMELLTSLKNKNTTVVITTHATHLLDLKNGEGIITMESGCIHSYRGACHV
jgi:cell division transport system ATP-binding protein